MKRRTFLKNTSALSLATLITPVGIFQTKQSLAVGNDLEKNFALPPTSARPHTWWHWMNGNVTKEGITLDLEAMARVGIGGFQNFDAGTGIPKGPVQYLSPEWLELKKHAIKEAERLGLEFTMHNCPGWSSSGGPWITPERAMQEVTWSEGLEPIDLTTSWTVSFPEKSGAPSIIDLPRLTSLHKHVTVGVKYFSGTAIYKKDFMAPHSIRKSNKRTYLNLGQVEVMAEIILNGKNLGIVWARPYRVDVTDAIKAGENMLEIMVTNLWPNRLIGDEQVSEPYKYAPGAGGTGFASLGGGAILELPEWYQKGLPKPDDGKITFTTWKHYRKDSPLLESGLIGPVFLNTGIIKDI